jgi:tRNA (guanine-N7-)-methyltransferase
MARRRKMYRFEQNRLAENVIERGKLLYAEVKGNWGRLYFGNENPLVLELGCGKGEYTVGLAEAYPDKNFIGVDIKGDRIARGSQAALEANLTNVAFLRTDIQFLQEFFAEQEVSEIWITFPDPQPRDRQEKHRLTYQTFLAMYCELLRPGGVLHLKTDSQLFFEYSLGSLPANGFEVVQATTDLYASSLNALHLGIKTKYEAMFYAKGFSINYLQSIKKG